MTIEEIASELHKRNPEFAEQLANDIFSYRDEDLEIKEEVSGGAKAIVSVILDNCKEYVK